MINAFRKIAERTEREERELREALNEYLDHCQREEEEERRKFIEATIPQNWIPNLYQEFEKRNLDYIATLGEEIGLMARMKEKFKGDERIHGFCHYFINLHICEIEELYGEIEEYRKFAKEFKTLRG